MRSMLSLADAQRTCRAAAADLPPGLRLDFYGARFDLRATSAEPLEYLRRVYSYFLDHAPEGSPAAEPRRMVLLEEGGAERAALLRALGRDEAKPGHLLAVDWFGWAFLLADEALLRYYASKLLRLGVVELLGGALLTLHGAGIQGEEGGVLLVGEAASGKTSIGLGLIERGFRYAADDTTCIRRRDGCCVPFPMPFMVRADLTTGRPPLPELAGRRPDIGIVDEPRWLVERWGAVASEFRPSHLVFLGADGLAPGEMREMPPMDAALELLRNVVLPLGADLDRYDPEGADLHLAVDLVEGARCLRADTRDLGRAFDNLLGLLAQGGARPARSLP